MNKTNAIIYCSRFQPISNSHGGDRRTAQIFNALQELNFDFLSAMDFNHVMSERLLSKRLPLPSELIKYLDLWQKQFLTQRQFNKWDEKLSNGLFYLSYVAYKWRNCIKNISRLNLAVVDDPIYFTPLVKYFFKHNIPVVAICHNIETLSKYQIKDHYQKELFKYELELLAQCRLVITISREETVLLNNLGINTYYYPYYPLCDVERRMLDIREHRKCTSKKNYLLLGTVGNFPTLMGMNRIIGEWGSKMKSNIDQLIVAGYCTEQLEGVIDDPQIVFKGPITDNELDALLSETKACIVYQENGSGALTKVVEYLLAGVPVIINSHAARSYYGLPGIIEYCDLEQIWYYLSENDLEDVECFQPKAPNSKMMLKAVRNCLV